MIVGIVPVTAALVTKITIMATSLATNEFSGPEKAPDVNNAAVGFPTVGVRSLFAHAQKLAAEPTPERRGPDKCRCKSESDQEKTDKVDAERRSHVRKEARLDITSGHVVWVLYDTIFIIERKKVIAHSRNEPFTLQYTYDI